MATPTQIRRRGRWSLILGTVFAAVLFAAVAYADDISNNLDVSVDAAAEVMPLAVGGANGTTELYVVPRNGDGKQGCNLTGSTTLGISVASSNPTVATVSASGTTFTSCVDADHGLTLTVTPIATGSTTITVAQTSNNTGATFNFATATFTVNVAPPPNTPPTVAVAGVTGGASYSKGSVPAATCQVTDTEDGDSSFPATVSAITGPHQSDGIGAQTASCSYTDDGGLTASASETYGIVDPSTPSVGYTLNPVSADGSNGWYKGNVSLTWNVSEPQSPNSLQKTGCVDQNITQDQAATTYSCSATSAGGSSGTPVSVTIKRDGSAPSVVYTSATPAANTAGWHKTDVVATFTATDNLSGFSAVALLTQTGTGTASVEGEGVIVGSPAFTDWAGNTAAAGTTTSASFNIDKTVPTVNCGLAPAVWSGSDVAIGCTASDSLSGLASAGDSSFNLTTNVAAGSETDAASTNSRTVLDKADNSAGAGPVTGIKVDKKAPTYLCASAPTTWSASDISINCTAADGGSGLNPLSDANFALSTSVAAGAETSTASTGSKVLKDAVNNTVTALAITGLKVDKKGPSITLTTPPSGASYLLNALVGASYSCSDLGSGLDTCIGTVASGSNIDTASVGSKSFAVNAKDMVGNTNSVLRTYTVGYDFSGFAAPVDRPNALNVSKAGQAIPLKWRLTDANGVGITTLTSVSVTVASVACAAGTTEDLIEEYAAGSSGLQNLGDGYYQFNWKTPTTYANSCKLIGLNLGEGFTRTGLALFSFKK